jgi:cytoplasmic iron level regulating protein YaaA (DUF328/UPF0246 family)
VLILLPPSEGKTAPRRGKPLDLDALSFSSLTPSRTRLVDALLSLCTTAEPATAARVLGLGPTQADQVALDARVTTSPTARADQVYSGVLYEALGVATLSATARRRATAWLAVTSGLFGLLRPSDRIPAYRLSGDVTMPDLGPVAAYWSRHLDTVVREAAGRGLVVDLRSSTYASFWRPGPDLAGRTVSVRVLHESGGRRSVVSHFNKATKGRIVRALLEDRRDAPATPAGLADRVRSLGWKVEDGERGRRGTRLDVVVAEL